MTEKTQNRLAYFIDTKKKTIRFVVALLVISAVIRVIFCRDAVSGRLNSFMQLVLPVAATLLLAVMLLLDGADRCYRTTVPIYMIAAYFAFRTFAGGFQLLTGGAICLFCLVAAVAYGRLTAGKARKGFLLILMFCVLGAMLFIYRDSFRSGNRLRLLSVLPDMIIPAAVILITLSLKIDEEGTAPRRWGDRCDGRRVRGVSPINIIQGYIMPTRIGASNFLQESLDIGELEEYVREKRRGGLKNFGITHAFLAAYVRCVARYPGINRFFSGQKIYTHGENIWFCMVIKSSLNISAQESVMKVCFHPGDTAEDIYRKMNEKVLGLKGGSGDKNGTDRFARALTYIPGLLIKFVVYLLRCLDYFGLLPQRILDISPFHGSAFLTSMGSLGIGPIVHHLYDFGNLPVFFSFGSKYAKTELDKEGNVVKRRYMDYTINTDERIVDGFYYATVFKYFKRLLADPSALDLPPAEINRDID